MLICDSKELKALLESNSFFKRDFEKIMLVFEKRVWTKDTCNFFKTLCEDLFKSFGIVAVVNIKPNISGDGKFTINFLETVETVEVRNKRKFIDIIKWISNKMSNTGS